MHLAGNGRDEKQRFLDIRKIRYSFCRARNQGHKRDDLVHVRNGQDIQEHERTAPMRYITFCPFKIGCTKFGALRRLYLGWLMIEYRAAKPEGTLSTEEQRRAGLDMVTRKGRLS